MCLTWVKQYIIKQYFTENLFEVGKYGAYELGHLPLDSP